MHVSDVTMLYAAQSGGVRRYLQEKRRWIAARPQYRHSLVLPRRAAPAGECAVELPSLPLPFSHGYRLPLARTPAVRALAHLRPQIIEAGDPYHLAWAALDAGQALGVPVVGFYHSDVPRLLGKLWGLRAERVAERYIRRLYTQFDRVLAPSAAMLARLQEIGIERAVHQPLGVDVDTFHPRRRTDAWRRALAAPPEARLLLFVGRFAPEKNLPLLLAALDRLGPRYLLVLVGNGTPPPMRANLRIVPYIDNPARLAGLIASCDLFVHAGDQETFGLAALEAMACGIPVVAPHAGGLAELVDAEVGASVPGRDPEAFADAVRAVFAADPARLGAAACRRAQRYDWNRVLPEIFAHYTALFAGGRC